MIFDTHSHLFESDFDSDRDECFKRLKEIDGKAMIVGFNVDNNLKAYELAKQYNMYSSAGLHPDEANGDIFDKLKKLEDFIKTHKVYAIGECGLDYHWVNDNIDIQKTLFEEQIKLSIKYDLPIIVHSRDAAKDTFDLINKYKGKVRGIMHCYSGSLEQALDYIKIGFYISLGGPVTFKNSKEPKRVAQNIDINYLLIETDCPFLSPEPFRGKRNESSYVKYTAEYIANLLNISYDKLIDITSKNAYKIFNIKE